VVYLPSAPLGEPPKTQLEWDWMICTQGWAVWFRGLVLRVLEGLQLRHAVIAHHGGPVRRKLLIVVLAIAGVIAYHLLGVVLARIP
jgi:hypothetical protein